MPDINGKIYRGITVNSQYVISLTPEHIKEYLSLKGIELPCDVQIGIRNTQGETSDLDPNTPIIVTCGQYEQSQTETDL
jgi:hypothetical protein